MPAKKIFATRKRTIVEAKKGKNHYFVQGGGRTNSGEEDLRTEKGRNDAKSGSQAARGNTLTTRAVKGPGELGRRSISSPSAGGKRL